MTEDAPSTATDDVRMTVGEHLDELRMRIVRCLVATVLAAIVVFVAHEPILDVVLTPARAALAEIPDGKIIQTEVGEGFFTVIRISVIVALFLVSPYLAWQIWSFVGAGLYPHERRFVKLFALPTYVLFVAGAVFAYLVVLPFGLSFLLGFLATGAPDVGGMPVEQHIKLSDYVGFSLTICLVMGFVFQLPLLMVALDRIGVVPVATFRRYRRHFLLGAFIVGAVLTPPDPVTQIAVASALVMLFEVGIWFAVFTGGGRDASGDTERTDA